jgi:cyclase
VGGGIRSVADARRVLLAGADKVSVNTAAVRRPELIAELSAEFGAQAVVLAIDARRRAPNEWNVFTVVAERMKGWTPSVGATRRRTRRR